MNGHINNVTYLAWALETVPREVYYNYELEQVCQHTCSSHGNTLAFQHMCCLPHCKCQVYSGQQEDQSIDVCMTEAHTAATCRLAAESAINKHALLP